jgi:hypothetical protein
MQRLLPPAADDDSVSNLEFLHESAYPCLLPKRISASMIEPSNV